MTRIENDGVNNAITKRLDTRRSVMIGSIRKDSIDRMILSKLSFYESLDLIELWYELGEDDLLKESVTEENISSRLESLKAHGVVVRFEGTKGDIRWALKKGEVGDDPTGL